ncbi:imidazole glycerol phosphate synthase subunit HisH [Sphingomonas sp. MMS24-J13]|uniref:imidazole glycerol phosphate synthase subunit HisH n=1 Tax=Sphingomonas sp. MMS24-J13 TaxID=3238686 RepID=UPI00384FE2AC
MSRLVNIVDYGAGNLYSVAQAVAKVGGEARLARDPAEIMSAERLLLPGVGAFASCANGLRERGLFEPILAFAATGRPFLGICVGMQLLFDHSLEFGRHQGLGLISGHVAPIPPRDAAGVRKVPHIGWTPLSLPSTRDDWEGSVLKDARPGIDSAYFVHSFNCTPADPACRLADADYEGFAVCAAVEKDNIVAFQCHPEKSGMVGLRIIEHFLTR